MYFISSKIPSTISHINILRTTKKKKKKERKPLLSTLGHSLSNAWTGHASFLVLWNAFHLFWGPWQSLLPAVALCWWLISHPCAFISVTKCTSISSTRKFLKHLVIALKEIWDCNHSFNKNTGFINIKYILHCSVFMPFCKHNDFFVCQITVKPFWRYFQ